MPDNESMSHCENVTAISSKFFEARRLLRVLYADDYEKQVAPWKERVLVDVRRFNLEILPAAIGILHRLNEEGMGMGMIWVLAAVVELVADQQTGTSRPDQSLFAM